MNKKILVLKIGTASITDADGTLNLRVMVNIARQVEALINEKKYHVILVSSGAVGTGRKYIKDYHDSLAQRKAAAAVGNPTLLNKYKQYFAPYGIPIAQVLCERNHFSDSPRFEQLKITISTLWENGILPIANENDVVNNLEIKFSDNDELATLLAVGFNANVLLFGTVVEGVLDKNGEVVSTITTFDKATMMLANKNKSDLGLGGMTSKLVYAKLATTLGINTIIFGIKDQNGINKAIFEKYGTTCPPQESTHDIREKWLNNGYFLSGRVIISKTGCEALKKKDPLLKKHLLQVMSSFLQEEVFEIQDETGILVGIARARCDEKTTLAQETIMANTNEIILL